MIESSVDENNGRLILAWVNLGSLVEGTMKLFLSVWYEDYKKDIDAIRHKGDLIDPDSLSLDKLREFFKKKIWVKDGDDWDTWILKIQRRRNAIHAYKNRDIGTFEEFYYDVRVYLKFLLRINNQLLYPW
ncbi:hypothetical protein J2128_000551 [Methanomicrobium sp. W14]|uniref:hypothetical protein n=1 Tax=Methanomicrobium sp. W14 TaxID=2817839 RepID=UPI001AE915CF|nr:hypothetical protein [Methanomicrobium sp. W14]MBP2132630.1 hypothetical protein [Methanomicrobium sp. W14]